MIRTYNDYLGSLKEIRFEDCVRLHEQIVEEVTGDPDAEELYTDLIRDAIDYVGMRAEWTIQSKDWCSEHDRTRTSYHDSVIASMNILANYLRGTGHAAEWRDDLGYDTDGPDRMRIGDFACFLVYVHGISGR